MVSIAQTHDSYAFHERTGGEMTKIKGMGSSLDVTADNNALLELT